MYDAFKKITVLQDVSFFSFIKKFLLQNGIGGHDVASFPLFHPSCFEVFLYDEGSDEMKWLTDGGVVRCTSFSWFQFFRDIVPQE